MPVAIVPPTCSNLWNTIPVIPDFPFKFKSPLICLKEEKSNVTKDAANVTAPPTVSKRGQRISLTALLVMFKSPPTRVNLLNVTPHRLSAEFTYNFPPTSSKLSSPVNSYPANKRLIVTSLVTLFKETKAAKERMVSVPPCRPMTKCAEAFTSSFARNSAAVRALVPAV